MDAFLILNERRHPIPTGDLIRIGTMDACDIRIPNDTYVSRQHCSVSLVDGELNLVDLGSTHGTFVNGQEVGRDPAHLQDGDRLQVGATLLTVSLVEAPAVPRNAAIPRRLKKITKSR